MTLPPVGTRQLLFCSFHCLLDPSSGAAVATRDLLKALCGWGWDVRALCGPQLDFEQGQDVTQVVSDLRLPVAVRQRTVGAASGTMLHLRLGDVPHSRLRGPDGAARRPQPQAPACQGFLNRLVAPG